MKIQFRDVPKGVFKGANFMTPTILGYYKNGNYYGELSQGTGFNNETIFGATFNKHENSPVLLTHNLVTKLDKVSKCLQDTERYKVEEYIEETLKELNA